MPWKNKNASGKSKVETADHGEDDDDDDDASNESISGSRSKTFEGENGRILNFLPTFSAHCKLKRAHVAAWRIGKSFFLSCRVHRKLRHFMRPMCRSASICLRSIFSFDHSPEEQERNERNRKEHDLLRLV